MLISQTEPIVETFFRQDNTHWLYTVNEGMESNVLLHSMQSEISLKAIYQKVDL